ncbi:MAG: hypothetical protein A3I77_06830 [Gammaproteobacteria bacterium RIFCSPLOWO2_02_FULL_42_14]|nr:MAG: hypothetical protein A3B71_02665 [Gammaproteobacteria bacterium RIFCSPHIGHO2_02_FULL_42_43]OGT51975.1 MAG: hypothetical protein A3E54_04170 [Gammaproteobacteria bacterium RIFCSPHIGHO2_12_FULL_41_25]OGT61080.1 MAG: hypothetical protein A3I77_06830 [Gammaproteobacteria bacterium RIFCSPLOWO2_02_FULL_42_14]OGT87008.1 MAG: hypothetical protein A3G86_00550 [Gammaproteobacteria bacterium RIFCSPLOWO2_12_FULL_42_18]
MNEYFEYKTSRWVRIYLILMHLFAAACSYAVMTAYGFVLFLFLGGIFCHVRRKRKRRIVALQYDRSKIWLLKTPNDEWIKAHLLPSSVLFRHVMILHFCEINTNRRCHLCLFSDTAQWKMLRRAIVGSFRFES